MVLTDYLKGIADAIRYAEGSTGEINAQLFAERIMALKVSDLPDEPVVPDEPEEPTLEVPQTGTWQLKTTAPKKYVILGTDDDNQGNAKYFRMLRTYGFPYTMNTEAEKINADLGSDVDTTIFTDADAPSIFGEGVTVADLGKYIHDNNLGEVAQHGSSANTLWDSENLVGDNWTTLYSYYTSEGGTKSEEELKAAIAELLAITDGSQDASYVEASRNTLEQALGFPILTVGAWGGSPQCTIDEIELDLNSFKGTSNYDWRAHNYFGVSAYVADFHVNTTPYNISRMNENPSEILKYIDMLPYGKVVEFFWHMPFHDEPDISKWRTLFDTMKQMQNEGKIDVITRYQYSQFGEYVDNPVVSISATRDGKIAVGETDDLSKYTVVATYQDGTTADVSDEAFVDNRHVVTTEPSNFDVYVTYRGIDTTIAVVVDDLENSNYVDYTFYDTVGLSKSNVVETAVKGVYVFPIEVGQTYYLNSTGKKGNHIIGYSDEAVPVKLAATTDGAQLGSWAAMTNTEITNPSGKSYLYYYYNGSDTTDVTLSKTAV